MDGGRGENIAAHRRRQGAAPYEADIAPGSWPEPPPEMIATFERSQSAPDDDFDLGKTVEAGQVSGIRRREQPLDRLGDDHFAAIDEVAHGQALSIQAFSGMKAD